MEIAFDPDKDATNLEQHKVSLAFGVRIFEDPDFIIIPTIRIEDGEQRKKVVGLVDGKFWTGVHVVRDGVVRFISVRRSNRGEERTYRA